MGYASGQHTTSSTAQQVLIFPTPSVCANFYRELRDPKWPNRYSDYLQRLEEATRGSWRPPMQACLLLTRSACIRVLVTLTDTRCVLYCTVLYPVHTYAPPCRLMPRSRSSLTAYSKRDASQSDPPVIASHLQPNPSHAIPRHVLLSHPPRPTRAPCALQRVPKARRAPVCSAARV